VKIVNVDSNWSVGVANANFSPAIYLGSDNNGVGFYPNDGVTQSFWINNALVEYATGIATPSVSANGDVVKIAGVGTKLFVQTPSMVATFGPDSWNSLPSVSFAAPYTGAVDFSVLGTGKLWLAFNEDHAGMAAELIVTDLTDGPAGYVPLGSA
jgi:hypothetical protein